MQQDKSANDGYQEKVVGMWRYAKVVKGGRKFSFGACVVIGNQRNPADLRLIGVGSGKSTEVPKAIEKAMQAARKNMKKVQLNSGTVPYEIISRHGSTTVVMRPSFDGGIVAGGAMRAVFEVLGVKNVTAKIIGSPNPINVVKATIRGLTTMAEPEYIAEKRGKTLEEIRD